MEDVSPSSSLALNTKFIGSSKHIIYRPKSVEKELTPTNVLHSHADDININPNDLTYYKDDSSDPLSRKRQLALRFSKHAEDFERKFPTNIEFDDSPLATFKKDDYAEKQQLWSVKGREEEKHVVAARALLEKEVDPNAEKKVCQYMLHYGYVWVYHDVMCVVAENASIYRASQVYYTITMASASK